MFCAIIFRRSITRTKQFKWPRVSPVTYDTRDVTSSSSSLPVSAAARSALYDTEDATPSTSTRDKRRQLSTPTCLEWNSPRSRTRAHRHNPVLSIDELIAAVHAHVVLCCCAWYCSAAAAAAVAAPSSAALHQQAAIEVSITRANYR